MEKRILLTGGLGKLGGAINKACFFGGILAPSSKELDITNSAAIQKFLSSNEIAMIIHCAAFARMKECEINPMNAIGVNIVGTCNLVREVLRLKIQEEKDIRFVYVSTDAVYGGKKGNYSEKNPAIPYNKYGWSKLGGECAVNLLSDFCIIRTSFFDPCDIKFEDSATDAFSSRMPINELAVAICQVAQSTFKGTINVGGKRESDYEKYKMHKSSLKKCRLKDILKTVPFGMAKDASMNTSLWRKSIKKF